MSLLGVSMGESDTPADRDADGISIQRSYPIIYKKITVNEINRLSKRIVQIQKNAIRCFDDAMEGLWRRAVGDWIEANRDRMGVSQAQLAEMVRVDASAVNKWINARSSIMQVHILKLQVLFRENRIPLRSPGSAELVLEGYRAAVAYIQSQLTGGKAAPPRGEEVLCLFHVYSSPNWAQKRIDNEPGCHFRDLGRE